MSKDGNRPLRSGAGLFVWGLDFRGLLIYRQESCSNKVKVLAVLPHLAHNYTDILSEEEFSHARGQLMEPTYAHLLTTPPPVKGQLLTMVKRLLKFKFVKSKARTI